MDDQFIADLYVAGWLHDIGKIAISNNILRKPSTLSATEYTTIQGHVIYGLNLLKSFRLNSTILKAIANHHERYDGNGYPYGRLKNEIPLEGRIIAIADAYSAMTVKRVYRRVLPVKRALQELKKEKGTQFDPKLVDIFVSSLLTNKDTLRAIC